MQNKFKQFLALHSQKEPLVIGNVWNVQSARAFEKAGYKAIATSSAAVAETLGYADGEEMPFEEYLFIINRIARSTNLPLSVDMEAGYGEQPIDVINNIRDIWRSGVVGINIEDSLVIDGGRRMVDGEAFANKLKAISLALQNERIELFINVRCDAFLLGVENAREESLQRIKLFEKTGVHGIFLPCIVCIDDIKAITSASTLPLNVMCMPDLPGFEKLEEAGVKRISMGNFMNRRAYDYLYEGIREVDKLKSFKPLFK